MHTKAWLGLLVAAIVIIGGGALVLSKQTNEEAEVIDVVITPEPSASVAPANDEVTVRLTASGFEPKQVTVKMGQTIVFVTDIRARISSDPHPVHTSNQELNLPTSEPGQSVRVTPTKTGTFGVHNHLDESQQMTIVVQP